MRSDKKSSGLAVFFICVLALVGVGTTYLLNMDLGGSWETDIMEKRVPLSDGEEIQVNEPMSESAPEPAPAEATKESPAPEGESVRVTVNPSGHLELGQTVKLSAHLRGFEKGTYKLRWQVKDNGGQWTDIQGAHERSLKLVLNEENIRYQWRVVADPIDA